MLPAATQALPAQPPEGAAEEVRAETLPRRHWIRRVFRLTAHSFDDVQEPVVAPKPRPKRSLS